MPNAMIDFGQEESINFYAGAGVGYAQVISVIGDDGLTAPDPQAQGSRSRLAIHRRRPLIRSQYFDIGLKYRYFNASNMDDNIGTVEHRYRLSSHTHFWSA